MLGRILIAALFLGLAVVSVPAADHGPVGTASAICIYVDALDRCLPNPTCTVAGVVEKVTGHPTACTE